MSVTIHNPDGCEVILYPEIHDGLNDLEKVEYNHYIIEGEVPKSKRGYITFHDDAGEQTTFSVDDIDLLIEALNEIKALHARRIK